jgi:sugar phosphate isomerase/epimerase
MPQLPIALQLYTVRDALGQDLDGGLKELAAIGYEHVELAGHYGLDAAELKSKLDAHGLKAIGGHVSYATPDGDAAQAAADAKVFGYDLIMQPYWPDDQRTVAGYQPILEHARKASAEHGLRFVYHNHDFEFDKLEDGRTAYEMLYDGTDLLAELDTCWVAVAGHDPVAWMNRLSGRVPLLHVKDCSDYGAKTLCELGKGKVPVADIVAAAPGVGVEALVIEQDNNWIDNDPLKSARLSYDALKKMVG